MKTYLRMLRYLRPYKFRLFLTACCIVVYSLLSGLSVLSVSPFVRILLKQGDSGAAETSVQVPAPGEAHFLVDSWWRLRGLADHLLFEAEPRVALARLCLALLILFLIKNVFHYLQTYLTSALEQRAMHDIRQEMYRRISSMRLAVFSGEKVGHFISRMVNDVNLMRTSLVGGAASVLRNGLMIIMALAILVGTSWKLALLAASILPPNAYLIAKLGKRLRRRSGHAQQSMADMASVVQETVTGARVVRAFGMMPFETKRFGRFNTDYFKNYLRVRRLQAMAPPLSEMLAMIGIFAILYFGGRLVLEQALPLHRLFLFLTAMIWLADPIKNLIGVNNVLQEGLVAGQRVFAFMDLPVEPRADHGGPARFERELRFENVSFGYARNRAVLRNVDLTVRPGEVVALVGPSGAGKSTFVDLLPRFYEVAEGRILLDDVDIRELSLESLRNLFGIVTQEVILFNDSVRANIAYGLPEVPQAEVEQAARAANAHEFIAALPRQYDTPIGDRGILLSGGERQRISIARAILRNPQILILDEATSALDSQNERLIQEALDRLMVGRTAFVVAHRLSTIHRADTIVVLDRGRIVEKGSHERLLKADGAYAKLHELQFR